MDFALTDDQELIRSAVAKVCADYPDEYWAEKDQNHDFPWDFYHAMANAGWIGTAIPEAYGGSGMGITEASIVLEEVAASGAAMNGSEVRLGGNETNLFTPRCCRRTARGFRGH